MTPKTGAICLCALLLAACDTGGGLGPGYKGLPPPPGTQSVDEAVDGLIVGHRLMAAGEYELALKAYYRGGAEQGLNADVYSAIGSANLRLGRLGQAEDNLRKAIELDQRFAPAWNNLGVVLMEIGETGEAKRVFQTAYALDSGNSDEIRENLLLAIAKIENPAYAETNENNNFNLVRRGNGRFLLLSAPNE